MQKFRDPLNQQPGEKHVKTSFVVVDPVKVNK